MKIPILRLDIEAVMKSGFLTMGKMVSEFERILKQAGFHIIHRKGIGLITPISVFGDFKGKLIPIWSDKVVNRLDPLFPKICHPYYVEATSNIL